MSSRDNKRQIREFKRLLKQSGNQQRRTREKEALKRVIHGDTDFIPEFGFDKPTKHWNGFDERK